MYRIIKIDGTELGITDSVNYNLVGHEDIEGADTVVVSEIDGGQELKSHQTTIEGLIRTILEG